mgnify:CR=1 FL=1
MQERNHPFDYELPEGCIAKYPAARREDARLLHVTSSDGGHDRSVADLVALLPAGGGIWVNETKVLHARMMAKKPTGGALELLLLEPRDMPVEKALVARSPVVWNAMVGGAKKWKTGSLEVPGSGVALRVEREAGAYRFIWDGEDQFGDVLERLGRIPLPPYMRRDAEASDEDRYQTVFARLPGSVAAPTAGLHLTEGLLDQLKKKGIGFGKVTLHVGVGTFKPLSGSLDQHVMHGERCLIEGESLRSLAEIEDLTVVGTTSLRTLESAFWLASRWKAGGPGPEEEVEQWIYKAVDAQFPDFQSAADWLANKIDGHGPLEFVTNLMVVPGYKVRSARRLLTNFHMPKSTLLCIVEAMVGPSWRDAYAHAIQSGYRFLSYGDACLLERSN